MWMTEPKSDLESEGYTYDEEFAALLGAARNQIHEIGEEES